MADKENKKIHFVSQREQGCFQNESCHVACLSMLLSFSGLKVPSYPELCSELNIESCVYDGYDYSAEEIVRFLVRYQINFRLMFRREEWQSSLNKAPIMVAMHGGRKFWGREGHAVILTQLEFNTFTYIDPWFKSSQNYTKHIDLESFYQHYSGFSCQIL